MNGQILECPDCDWTTKPKHKRPKSALALHRKAKHSSAALACGGPDDKKAYWTYPTIQAAVDALPDGGRVLVQPGTYHEQVAVHENVDIRGQSGFLVTFTSGEERHVPAEEHQETMDRHWFFRGGALKETFKRKDVAAVEVA
jgi:hypothetical protein